MPIGRRCASKARLPMQSAMPTLPSAMQGTGGSSAMANSWMQLRQAGATARAMLVAAAAKDGMCRRRASPSRRALSTMPAAIAKRRSAHSPATASSLPVPNEVPLKAPKDFKLIGQQIAARRHSGEDRRHGAIHLRRGAARHAGGVVAACAAIRRHGQIVRRRSDQRVPGVVEVVQVPRGVAVVARSFWAAKQGRDALKVEWDDSKAEKRSSAAIMAEYRRCPTSPARRHAATATSPRRSRAPPRVSVRRYEFPYLAHAPMEPLDAVVKLNANGCEIWAGDQFQTVDQGNAAATAGLKPEQVKIHTLLAGGSFGRRANTSSDYIVEAVSIAKALGADGVPVKLQWTREDDIRGGLYRPVYVHRLEAAWTRTTAWSAGSIASSANRSWPARRSRRS